MKTARIIVSSILILVIVFCGIIVFEKINFSSDTTPVTITIKENSSSSEIYAVLKENGLAKTKIGFLINLKLSPYSGKLKAGTFTLNKSMSFDEILKTLSGSGISNRKTFTLTIPEGYSIEKIATKLESENICTKEEFLNALSDEYNYDFIKDIPTKNYKYKLQGFLFPSTYEFFEGATAHDIIDKMLGEFENRYLKLKNNTNFTMHDVITLASLIEREAQLPSERYTISGVLKNRLNINMPLQIDASIVYFISDGEYNVDLVTYDHLKMDSLYNTYKNTGLPVGPKCNPGIESIKAALNPENHSYLYYHTDETKKDGSHIFTENYGEHLATQ